MKPTITFIVLSLNLICQLAWSSQPFCVQILNAAGANSYSRSQNFEVKDLGKVLDETFGESHEPSFDGNLSVHTEGLASDDHIVLVRDPKRSWNSNERVIPEGFTKQGDPRTIIQILGPEVASLLGFKLFQRPNGIVELHVPKAALLEKKLIQANRSLKARGFEPIAYLPRSASFLNAEDFLSMTTHSTGDFEIVFPFADSHPQLVVHEVSFHLGALVFPKIVLQRARLINEKTEKLIKLLKAYGDIDPVPKVINQLFSDRTLELDFGTADAQLAISILRTSNLDSKHLIPYREINQHANIYTEHGILNFDRLAFLEFKPSEVVALKLLHAFGLEKTQEFKRILAGRNLPQPLGQPEYGIQRAASYKLKMIIEMEILPKLLQDADAENSEMRSASEVFFSNLSGLDQRLEAIKQALIP